MDKDYVSIRRLGRFLTQLKGLFVQKVSGKGLSTEDYTTEEKTKLAGIASGAEVNVIEGVQVNGADLTPDANRKVNVVVPENVAHKVSGATSGNFAALNAQGDLTDSGKDASDFGSAADVEAINEKIPTQASAGNQLADKNFVNSSIQTATATFRGIMDCWCALGALGSAPDNNDYAVLKRCNDYIYKFEDDPDEPHNIGDIFGYDGIVYRVVTDFLGSFDETKCEKIGEFALYGGEPDGAGGVQRYYSYSIEGKTYFRIADWDVDNPDGLSPSDPGWIPANWVLIEGTCWEVDTPLATWRWKYSGPSGSGVYAWRAEYQINDAPLTAAQIAALNSNITEALTNKLVALPAKPVDTAVQTLTEAEKQQARANIGATAPEVFWATYGVTTYAEVATAISEGKVVVCVDGNGHSWFATIDTSAAYFYMIVTNYVYVIRLLANTNVWQVISMYSPQTVANLVSSWRATPDNTHYPSEKLVYDSMFVKGVISQTQTWVSDYGSYTLSDVVRGDIPRSFIDMWNSRVLEFGTFNETTGYFELNGLTDISYAEARDIVQMYEKGMSTEAWGPVQNDLKSFYTARTGIPTNPNTNGMPTITWNIYLEVTKFQYPNKYRYFNSLTSYGCYRLRRMIDKYKINSAVTLNSFYALEECYFSLTNDFTATASKYLSLASVVYMVENARNTGAVTYTLHSDAYARCQADTTEYTYAGQTYTGILALASAKNITIASA